MFEKSDGEFAVNRELQFVEHSNEFVQCEWAAFVGVEILEDVSQNELFQGIICDDSQLDAKGAGKVLYLLLENTSILVFMDAPGGLHELNELLILCHSHRHVGVEINEFLAC